MRVIKSSPFIFCLFFCLVEMIAGILNNNIAFLIAGIMNFLTIVVFVDYLVKSDGFSSADWFAFTTYDWACILYFIFTYEGLNLSNRFKGIYWNQNNVSNIHFNGCSFDIFVYFKSRYAGIWDCRIDMDICEVKKNILIVCHFSMRVDGVYV